jgi:hypothetical protein
MVASAHLALTYHQTPRSIHESYRVQLGVVCVARIEADDEVPALPWSVCIMLPTITQPGRCRTYKDAKLATERCIADWLQRANLARGKA